MRVLFYLFLIMCIFVGVEYVHIRAGALRDQKRAPDSLEL